MTDLQWTRVTDAGEGAFSLELPAGWQHDVRSFRVGPAVRRAARAVSPDGSVRLSLHDPDLPNFFEPSSGFIPTPGVHQIAPYVEAGSFLPQYLQQRFGTAPGFAADAPRPEPDLAQQSVQQSAAQGVQLRVTSASAPFRFTDQGRPVEALAIGSTLSFGSGWVADVCVVFAVGGQPDRQLLLHAMQSERTNQQWQAGENQRFAGQQAINAQQSALWMQTSQAMHDQRMSGIAAAGAANTAIHNERVATAEAGTAAYLDRLNQSMPTGSEAGVGAPGLDEQHRFINALREEETVRTGTGDDVQVDAGADRYFVDEANRRWVGASGNVQANDFTAAGLNPDDWQEGEVRR
ncbi:MAG: hypothetical protein IPL41_03515 [Micropruina sp.]|nr:hypothetical protein [Micropruina sp.]